MYFLFSLFSEKQNSTYQLLSPTLVFSSIPFLFVGNHNWQYSRVTRDSAFKFHSWQCWGDNIGCWGDHIRCWGLNLVWLQHGKYPTHCTNMQTPNLISVLYLYKCQLIFSNFSKIKLSTKIKANKTKYKINKLKNLSY